MSIEDIINFREISEDLASSGQPGEGQFGEIADAGFEVVINLAMPNSDNAIPEEGYIVTARNMIYVHMPIPFDAPRAEHLKSFCSVMDAFEGKKCWVHCALNYRVSAFLYQYFRLARNVSREKAEDVVLSEWKPDSVWREFMALERKDVWS